MRRSYKSKFKKRASLTLPLNRKYDIRGGVRLQ